MKNRPNFIVKILYFKNKKVNIYEIEVVEGTKAIDAIKSFHTDFFEKIKENNLSFGVFGKLVSNNYILKDYHPFPG